MTEGPNRTFLDGLFHFVSSATSGEGEDSRKETLTESDDGQDDGDGYGHPGNPQSFLAVTLRLVRLQTHAALQKTCGRHQMGHCQRMHGNTALGSVSEHFGRLVKEGRQHLMGQDVTVVEVAYASSAVSQ